MILVDIYTPAVDRSYDFMLDENADLSAVIIEVVEMIARKTGSERPSNTEDFVLYLAGTGTPIPPGRTLYENGVRDGDRLILV